MKGQKPEVSLQGTQSCTQPNAEQGWAEKVTLFDYASCPITLLPHVGQSISVTSVVLPSCLLQTADREFGTLHESNHWASPRRRSG